MEKLTPRERQVLELVVAGKLNKTIADVLGISIKTVELHRSNLDGHKLGRRARCRGDPHRASAMKHTSWSAFTMTAASLRTLRTRPCRRRSPGAFQRFPPERAAADDASARCRGCAAARRRRRPSGIARRRRAGAARSGDDRTVACVRPHQLILTAEHGSALDRRSHLARLQWRRTSAGVDARLRRIARAIVRSASVCRCCRWRCSPRRSPRSRSGTGSNSGSCVASSTNAAACSVSDRTTMATLSAATGWSRGGGKRASRARRTAARLPSRTAAAGTAGSHAACIEFLLMWCLLGARSSIAAAAARARRQRRRRDRRALRLAGGERPRRHRDHARLHPCRTQEQPDDDPGHPA